MTEKKLSEYLEKEVIANNATFALAVTGKVGFGELNTSDLVSYVRFFFKADGTFKNAYSDGMAWLKDTTSTLNMYTEGSDIILQNKTGAEITVYHNLRRGDWYD